MPVKNARILSQNIPPITHLNARFIKELGTTLDVLTIPYLVEEADLVKLLDKHKESLGYTQDPHKPRKPNGFVYQSHLSFAEVIEQQSLFLDTFEKPASELTPQQQVMYREFVQNNRWLYLPITTLRATVACDSQTFFPAVQLLSDTSQDSLYTFQFGYTCETFEMPTCIYQTRTIKDGVLTAYDLMEICQSRELAFFSSILGSMKGTVALTPDMIYYGYRLAKYETVLFVGSKMTLALTKADPHQRYLFQALKAEQGDEPPANTDKEVVLFEASNNVMAVQYTASYVQRRQMDCFLLPTLVSTEEIADTLADFHGFSTHKITEITRTVKPYILNKRLMFNGLSVLQFTARNGNIYTIYAARQHKVDDTDQIIGFVCQGSPSLRDLESISHAVETQAVVIQRKNQLYIVQSDGTTTPLDVSECLLDPTAYIWLAATYATL